MNKFDRLYKIILLSAVVILICSISLKALAQTEKGIELYTSWEFKKAEEAFREVLKKEPSDVQAGYYLGLSLLMQAKYQEALGFFLKAKDLIDKAALSGKTGILDKGQLEVVLTRVYLELEKYPEALEHLEAAEKAKANPADIHTFRGAYYIEKNDANKAVKELEEALKLDSQNAYAYYYAGHAFLRLGNPAKAVELFKMFLRLAPYAPEAVKAKALIDALC